MPKTFDLGGGSASTKTFDASLDASFASLTPPVQPTPATAVAVSNLTGVPGKPLELPEIISAGQAEASQITVAADKINAMAKLSDMDEIGTLFTKTMMAAKGYDIDNLMKGGLLSFIRGKATQMQMRFDSVDGSVKKLVTEVDKRIVLFIQRLGDIKQMRDDNVQTRRALKSRVDELIARAEWMEANVPEVDPNDNSSAARRREWLSVATMARSRADNLERAITNAEQQHALLGMTAENSAMLAMKFGIIKETTVPAMKTSFAMGVMNNEQTKGVDLADMLDASTNEAMQKVARGIGQNVTKVHTSLSRSSISIETLQIQHESVIKALDEVERIRAETKQRLANEAPIIKQLSSDLTQRLARA